MGERYAAVGFFYHHPTRRVLLQHRSRDAPRDPDRWGVFGGGEEDEDGGDPRATWRRELREELGVELAVDQVVTLWSYVTAQGERRYVFSCTWSSVDHEFVLGEGQGCAWFTIDEALRVLALGEHARRDLERLRDHTATGGARPAE